MTFLIGLYKNTFTFVRKCVGGTSESRCHLEERHVPTVYCRNTSQALIVSPSFNMQSQSLIEPLRCFNSDVYNFWLCEQRRPRNEITS